MEKPVHLGFPCLLEGRHAGLVLAIHMVALQGFDQFFQGGARVSGQRQGGMLEGVERRHV